MFATLTKHDNDQADLHCFEKFEENMDLSHINLAVIICTDTIFLFKSALNVLFWYKLNSKWYYFFQPFSLSFPLWFVWQDQDLF